MRSILLTRHTMELHMTIIAHKKRKKKLSTFTKTNEVPKCFSDGKEPSSLLVFVAHHRNPATQKYL